MNSDKTSVDDPMGSNLTREGLNLIQEHLDLMF